MQLESKNSGSMFWKNKYFRHHLALFSRNFCSCNIGFLTHQDARGVYHRETIYLEESAEKGLTISCSEFTVCNYFPIIYVCLWHGLQGLWGRYQNFQIKDRSGRSGLLQKRNYSSSENILFPVYFLIMEKLFDSLKKKDPQARPGRGRFEWWPRDGSVIWPTGSSAD